MIEALIAILIFSLGILGMVAMGGTAIGAQSDARYRTDASQLADNIANLIALNVDRSTPNTPSVLQTSLTAFQHQPAGTVCAFSGAASAMPLVTGWLSQVTTTGPGLLGLPGTVGAGQQILVTTTGANGFNRVEITICWRDPGTPTAAPMRRHTLVTFVN